MPGYGSAARPPVCSGKPARCVPVAAKVGRAVRDHDHVTCPWRDLMLAPRTEVRLHGLVRLDPLDPYLAGIVASKFDRLLERAEALAPAPRRGAAEGLLGRCVGTSWHATRLWQCLRGPGFQASPPGRAFRPGAPCGPGFQASPPGRAFRPAASCVPRCLQPRRKVNSPSQKHVRA
jgi:hypothetical protein